MLALRFELVPAQRLLARLLGRPIPGWIGEDNNATIIAVQKGYSPTLRHLQRSQRVSLGYVHEVVTGQDDTSDGNIELAKVDTSSQKGDSFTKYLTPKDFHKAMDIIGITNFPSNIS